MTEVILVFLTFSVDQPRRTRHICNVIEVNEVSKVTGRIYVTPLIACLMGSLYQL